MYCWHFSAIKFCCCCCCWRNNYDNVETLNRNEPRFCGRISMTLSVKSIHQTVMCMAYLHHNSMNNSYYWEIFLIQAPPKGVSKWKNPPPIYSFTFKEIDVAAVHSDLDNIDGDSSNVVLQVDAKLLRMSADVICRTLTHLCNASLSSMIIQVEWKTARITPIYKESGKVYIWKLITVQYQYSHTSQRCLKEMCMSKLWVILSITGS